jgi:ubiquinone/menaquinone biosynthesis C-methylase UbiE
MIPLLEPLRRRRERPEVRLRDAGMAVGLRVADIGAGYGYYAIPALEIVGAEGFVYAVEPNPKRASEISKRIGKLGAHNFKVLEATAEDLGEIPPGDVDVAIAMSSFHHFEDRRKALQSLRRIVRPGGTIYIRDMKAGRIFKHGSDGQDFRGVVSSEFRDATFDEDSGHITARIRV